MEYKNKLTFKTFKQFYNWLAKNHDKTDCCWIKVNRGKPDNKTLSYYDAVYVALCFGWIDSIFKKIGSGMYSKFSPRRKTGHWTQLNIYRCKKLIKQGLMTKAGLDVMPKDTSFKINADLKKLLSTNKLLAKNFKSFPKLYQIIRLDSIQRYEKQLPETYKKAKANFIKQTLAGKMYGNWNDDGRLG